MPSYPTFIVEPEFLMTALADAEQMLNEVQALGLEADISNTLSACSDPYALFAQDGQDAWELPAPVVLSFLTSTYAVATSVDNGVVPDVELIFEAQSARRKLAAEADVIDAVYDAVATAYDLVSA